jgi:hypothetical protein
MATERGKLWVERLVWILIYGGLLAVSLGVFVLREGETLWGWIFIGKGAVVAAVGAVLVYVRSRMKDSP